MDNTYLLSALSLIISILIEFSIPYENIIYSKFTFLNTFNFKSTFKLFFLINYYPKNYYYLNVF